MANNIWSNYTEKTATPVDADEVMVRDSTDGKNKRLLFGTFWKWVAKKLNEATISELQTSNKTIVGALNQLNSETWDSIGTYDIPASDTGITVQIPSNAKEILLFVGSKNKKQVYGGKSYIMRVTPINIVYEKEVFSAAGNNVGTGFYAYCNNNTLIMKCQTSNTVIAQVYTK